MSLNEASLKSHFPVGQYNCFEHAVNYCRFVSQKIQGLAKWRSWAGECSPKLSFFTPMQAHLKFCVILRSSKFIFRNYAKYFCYVKTQERAKCTRTNTQECHFYRSPKVLAMCVSVVSVCPDSKAFLFIEVASKFLGGNVEVRHVSADELNGGVATLTQGSGCVWHSVERKSVANFLSIYCSHGCAIFFFFQNLETLCILPFWRMSCAF